jgi:hypothetical protein
VSEVHPLYNVIAEIDRTHPKLGNAVAFACICVKAKKCLLVISPAGCGKSAVSDAVASHYPDAIKIDSVTRSGLRDFKDVFTHYQGLVAIDDLGKVDTNYSRIATVTSFAELCYSHFISKHTMTVTVEIAEFFGSAILNVQPPVLASLVEADEWEVVTQDKTIRYYHLYRPTKPNSTKPVFNLDWGIDMPLVHKPDHRYKLHNKLENIASIQWSDARVLEHLDDLLKASAALDHRTEVDNNDYVLLNKLMKPMTVEKYCRSKYGFETGRAFNTNLMAVLVEFASWPNINIARIARDYKVSESTVYRLLSEIKDWFEPSEPMSKKLNPKPELSRVLKEAGVIR